MQKVLADYVIALLKHDKTQQDLSSNCISQLEDFLKEETTPFVTKLFAVLDSKSYMSLAGQVSITADTHNAVEPSGRMHDDLDDDDDQDRNFKHSRGERHEAAQNAEDRYPKRRRSTDGPDDYSDRRGIRHNMRMGNNGFAMRGGGNFQRGRGFRNGPLMRGAPYPPLSQQGPPGMPPYGRMNPYNRGPPGPQGMGGRWENQGAEWGAGSFPGQDPQRFGGPRMDRPHPVAMHGRVDGYPATMTGNRMRCLDYDEQGFCMRGDQCPYEHSVDRVGVDPMIMGRGGPGFNGNPMQGMRMPAGGMGGVAQASNVYGAQAEVAMQDSDAYDPEQPQGPVDVVSPIKSGMMMQGQQPYMMNGANDMGMAVGGRGGFRGHGRGAFRGRGGRGAAHGQMPYHRPVNDTIVIEHIPPEHCNLDSVNSYFKKFGTITNIQMQPQFNKAIVSYQTAQEAMQAKNSPDVIFANRFVKVYFMAPGGLETGGKPPAAFKTTLPESPVNGRPPIPAATATVNPNAAPLSHQPAPTISKTEEKKKQALSMLELQKQKEQLIQKQIEYQKELMEKLESKKLNPKDRAELMEALKAAEEATRQSLSNAVSATATVKAIVPMTKRPTAETKQKEKLDMDLDHLTKEGDEVDPELKAQLESLKAEAKSLGVDPSVALRGGRGRGRGAWRGGRGATRSFNLDNRTTKILVRGVPAPEKDKVKAHLEALGAVVAFTYNDADSSAVIQYQLRREAEQAFHRPPKTESGPVQMSWIDDRNTATSGAGSTTGTPPSMEVEEPDLAEIEQRLYEEDDDDEEKKRKVTMSFALPTLPASKLAQKKAPAPTPDTAPKDQVSASSAAADAKPKAETPKEAAQDTFVIPPKLSLNYRAPAWNGLTTNPHSLEVLKNGTIVETIDIIKPFMLIG
ncbi:hypothetical protein HDV05_005924 [Chytridiales sp. JEL 0842]|nr:hypothetical protein HDV05_005924 [Chytridiales sp. JEL 0842]